MSRGELAPTPDRLPLPVVDNHCHLTYQREESAQIDVADTIARACEVGVTRMVQIGCSLESARETVELVQQHPQLVGAVAMHPSSVPELALSGQLPAALAEIEELAQRPRIRAVSESGLDYYWTKDDEGKAAQQDAFRWHIDLAKRLGKPLQIHDRDAHADVLRILREEGPPEQTVFHCFSGDVPMAVECAEQGYYLSFSGTVTFKNNRELRDALAVAPVEQVLVETDAPYLTPHPHRGSINAPHTVPLIVRCMAETMSIGTAELCASINATSEKLYGPWE